MKSSQKKVSPSNDVNADEVRKTEEQKLKREEEMRRKREEFKEVQERSQRQREAAEEGMCI